MRAPLANRSFRRLFLARCASILGDSIFLVAIAFAVLEISDAAAAIGSVLAVGSIMLILSFLVSGVWGDRLPRVGLMLTSDLVRLVAQATLAALLITDHATIPLMMLLYGLHSVATAFFEPARTAVTPQILEPHLLLAGNGLMGTAHHTVSIAGWAIGGLLVAWLGAGGAIAVDSVTFAASALLIWSIGSIPNPGADTPREPFRAELAIGWRELRAHRWLWFTVLNATMFLLVYEAPMQVLGPLTTQAKYDGALTWGLLGAALAGGAVIGSFIVASQRLRRPMLCSLWLFFATALIPICLGLTAPFPILVVVSIFAGAAWGMFEPIWTSSMQRRVPADKLSRVAAWDWMGSLAGMPIGFLLAGVAVDAFGREYTLLGIAALTLAVCIAFLLEPTVRVLGDDFAQGRTNHSPPDPV